MKAIGYTEPGPAARPDALITRKLPDPIATGHDILVRVSAVSVNPVDTHLRRGAPAANGFGVLGYDAVGTVDAVGSEVSLFKRGDRVWYAGSIARPGTNSELHLVDERIVSLAPTSLSDADAAALPLVAITAWEMLFDRFDVARPVAIDNRTILIIGGAGGVGSIAIQIAKRVAGMTVIATASRPETIDFVRAMGADHVVDHSKPMAPQIAALGIGAPGFVFSTTGAEPHFDDIAELIAPQGRIGVIAGIGKADANALTGKSVSLHFELMFTRSSIGTPDMVEQHHLLDEVARLVDAGTLKTTRTEHFGRITPEDLLRAHTLLESGKAIGKIVLEGF
jgi:NADPH2:quinone reductase